MPTVVATSCRECDEPIKAKGLCSHHYNVAYYASRRSEMQKRSRDWYAANPERAAANRARRDPEKMRAGARDWYQRNQERALENSRRYRRERAEVVAATQLKYRQANRLRLRVKAANERARRFGLPGQLTLATVEARGSYFGNMCWICGGPWDDIDHVKPTSSGGANHPSNIRPACEPCNLRKHARWEGVAQLPQLVAFVLERMV